MKQLAQRFGMPLPELEQSDEQRASAAERETLLKIHEAAAAWFREQLLVAGGRAHPAADRRPRHQRRDVGGAGPRLRAAGARRAEAGAARRRASRRRCSCGPDCSCSATTDRSIDRFRNRLMIPICRDTGSVIAFGGRALEAGPAAEVPEFAGNADLFEGPHALRPESVARRPSGKRGFACSSRAISTSPRSFRPASRVVASCGTALTPQQAQQLQTVHRTRSCSASIPMPRARAPRQIVRNAGGRGV